MNKYIRSTPEGTRDLLFTECTARRVAEKKLINLFKSRGYNEVITPTLEYFDIFSGGSATIPQEELYKLTDNNGKLLVLRPDMTAPIARLAATRLGDSKLPIRLYYNNEVFRNNRNFSGRNDEVAQAGIELIGADGFRADLEVIVTALEALDNCGVPDYRLELSDVGYFTALMDDIPADDLTKEDIRLYIDRKNYTSLDYTLDKLEQTQSVKALRRLPRLFGGVEVIEEAESLFTSPEASQSLSYLRHIYEVLCGLGMKDKVSIDLGLVSGYEYYTGVVFKGYMHGAGAAVISGGRYNKLLGEFGRDLPAIGFAAEVDSIAAAILEHSGPVARSVPDVLVFGTDGYELKALQYAYKLITEGRIAENCVFSDIEMAKEYARSRGICRIDIVGVDISTVLVGGEE